MKNKYIVKTTDNKVRKGARYIVLRVDKDAKDLKAALKAAKVYKKNLTSKKAKKRVQKIINGSISNTEINDKKYNGTIKIICGMCKYKEENNPGYICKMQIRNGILDTTLPICKLSYISSYSKKMIKKDKLKGVK